MLQYIRISVTAPEKRLCRIIIIIQVLQNLSLHLAHLTRCSPFEANWNRSIPGAKCLNGYIIHSVGQSSIIAFDLAILVLPAFILRHLTLRWYQKLAIAVALSFGSLCVSLLCTNY